MNHRLLFILLLFFCSCGGLLDISGRGAKTECLYLDTPSCTVMCTCRDRSITHLLVREGTDRHLLFELKPDTITREIPLHISLDSIGRNLEIELYLSGSAPRETYYIDVPTAEKKKTSRIYARCIAH